MIRWGQVVLWDPLGPEGKRQETQHRIKDKWSHPLIIHTVQTAQIHETDKSRVIFLCFAFVGESFKGKRQIFVHLNSVISYVKNINHLLCPKAAQNSVALHDECINCHKFLSGI